MTNQKITKDLSTLSDLAILAMIKDSSQAVQFFQNQVNAFQAEADRRIAAGDANLKTELGQQIGQPAAPAPGAPTPTQKGPVATKAEKTALAASRAKK